MGREHLHTEDVVRFIVSGGGIFDIRSNDDQWMRVEVVVLLTACLFP